MGTGRGPAVRALVARSERCGIATGVLADRNAIPYQLAAGDSRRTAARHYYARQRVREGQRRLLLPCGRRKSGAVTSSELSVCDLTAGANDVAQRGWPVRAGRNPVATRQGQRQIADHSGPGY